MNKPPTPLSQLSERYQLEKMLGSGLEGVAYAAVEVASGKPVVLHRLRLEGDRLRAMVERLKLLSLVHGDGFLRPVEAELSGSEPFLVMPRDDGARPMERKLDRADAFTYVHGIAMVLASAHRIGLIHGSLGPSKVMLFNGRVTLDFLQPATGVGLSTELDAACRGPDKTVSAGDDLYALGSILTVTLTGRPPPRPDETATQDDLARLDDARPLLRELLDPEPSWRPSAAEAAERLAHLRQGVRDAPGLNAMTLPAAGAGPQAEPTQLGRYKLEGMLGKGAMGRVFRAVDLADGRVVALKVLDAVNTADDQAVKRFRKEARLLSEINNPFIANLLEANRDQGLYFMAVELVEGQDLNQRLKSGSTYTEAEVLSIGADLCRALIDVHARGIVHRDLKPANVMGLERAGHAPSVRLVDFGVARHVKEHASLQVTELGAAVGTPVFMSPEQCRGDELDGKSDIYSLAMTLYTLMSGKPPFVAETTEGVFSKHLFEVPPLLNDVVPPASNELSMLLARCMEKEKAKRPDASQLLVELERLQHLSPQHIAEHPARPKRGRVLSYRFEWNLKASPKQLWKYVANTDRLNRAIGLGPVEESFRSVEGEIARIGKSSQAGQALEWREHPFEWVQFQRLGVVRELTEGPLYWLRNTVDLEPLAGGGTHLVHTIELEPRHIVGRVAASLEVGLRTRLALARVYQRIDELLEKRDGPAVVSDAFEQPHQLSASEDARLAQLEKAMVARGADPLCTTRLGELLRLAPPQEVARMRPLPLARRLGLDPNALVNTFLIGAKEGALELAWDLVCPSCRVASQIKDTLREVKEHGRCEVCSIDYELDLAASVELVFSVHPAIRKSERKLYCLGSPGHVPHVLAQIRVAAGERFELALELDDGAYRLAGRKLAFTLDFRVAPSAGTARWELPLSKAPGPELRKALGSGAQVLVLINDTGREQLVRVERAVGREDALTAAKVASQPLFRKLFPHEVLAPGQLVNVSNVALLMVEVAPDFSEPNDSGSFSGRYALFRRLQERAVAEGGAVVKIAGEGVVAVFADVAGAVRAALGFGDDPVPLRVAVHRGQAAAVTLDEHMDYFGRAVRETSRLLERAQARQLVLSEAAASDPGVLALSGLKTKKGSVHIGESGTAYQQVHL